MDTTQPKNVFVSYSRTDEDLATSLRMLIEVAAGAHFIFQDTRDLKFGEEWQEQLQQAIANSDLTMVFWCKHSSDSTEVKKEFEYAQNIGKKILPIFLDDTPIDSTLSKFHGLNFINKLNHNKVGRTSLPPPSKMDMFIYHYLKPIILITLYILSLILLSNLNFYNSQPHKKSLLVILLSLASTIFLYTIFYRLYRFIKSFIGPQALPKMSGPMADQTAAKLIINELYKTFEA